LTITPDDYPSLGDTRTCLTAERVSALSQLSCFEISLETSKWKKYRLSLRRKSLDKSSRSSKSEDFSLNRVKRRNSRCEPFVKRRRIQKASQLDRYSTNLSYLLVSGLIRDVGSEERNGESVARGESGRRGGGGEGGGVWISLVTELLCLRARISPGHVRVRYDDLPEDESLRDRNRSFLLEQEQRVSLVEERR
jgi:hypothetical protein